MEESESERHSADIEPIHPLEIDVRNDDVFQAAPRAVQLCPRCCPRARAPELQGVIHLEAADSRSTRRSLRAPPAETHSARRRHRSEKPPRARSHYCVARGDSARRHWSNRRRIYPARRRRMANEVKPRVQRRGRRKHRRRIVPRKARAVPRARAIHPPGWTMGGAPLAVRVLMSFYRRAHAHAFGDNSGNARARRNARPCKT
jgi:hypothetical protein